MPLSIKQNTSHTAQAMWIGFGSLCSFLFSVVSSAILSRYLTKDAYGTYKQVMYVYATLLSVFTLGLPLAYSYFLPRVGINEGKTLTQKLNKTFLFLGFIFSLVLFFGADTFASLLKNSSLCTNIRIFSPVPMMIMPTLGLQGVLATYKKTIWNALYVVVTRILMLFCVAMPAALFRSGSEMALWGFVVASGISLAIAYIIQGIPFKAVMKEPCSITYKEIFQYSVPLMSAGLFSVILQAADQFFVSRYYGREVFAEFVNGSNELPLVGMVLSASATVLLPTFSRMTFADENYTNIVNLWKRTAVKAALMIYPLVVFTWFFASDLIILIYGDRYAISAVYFRIMVLVNLFTVIPFYPVIMALGKLKDYVWSHLIICIAVWGLEFLSVVTIHSPYAITIVSASCNLAKILLLFNVVARAIKLPMHSLIPLRSLSKVFFNCALAGLVSWFVVKMLLFSNIKVITLGYAIVLYACLTLIGSKFFKIDYLEVLKPFITKQER